MNRNSSFVLFGCIRFSWLNFFSLSLWYNRSLRRYFLLILEENSFFSWGFPSVAMSICNGYRCRKWTRRHKFKSWTRLIAFRIALIPLGKVWIQLLLVGKTGFFSLQLWYLHMYRYYTLILSRSVKPYINDTISIGNVNYPIRVTLQIAAFMTCQWKLYFALKQLIRTWQLLFFHFVVFLFLVYIFIAEYKKGICFLNNQ